VSIPVTVAISTVAFCWRLRMPRIGQAMSAGERTAVAT
jgi:hypothetical protein